MQRSVAVAAVGATLVVLAVPSAARSAGHPTARPGCEGTPPVVAHHPGGHPLRPRPRHLPRACGVTTGYPGAESHIVVRNDGTVVYTPAVLPDGLLGTNIVPVDQNPDAQSNASPGALAVTSDRGAHWRVVKPAGVTWNPTDHSDYVDPATGRMFFEDYGPIPLVPGFGAEQEGPAHISWTDDLRHWHHTALPGMFLPENPRFASGVAPAGRPKPVRYPTVTYFCANTNVGFVSPVIAGRVCYRSLDGGTSWAQGALLFSGAVPQHPECGGQGENYSAIDGYYPQPAPNGWLYVMVSCGGKTYLARSTDEAATFPVVHGRNGPVTLPVPATSVGDVGGTPELRIASDGTFLLGYQVGSRLLLRVSTTRGMTWGAPLDVTAPGVAAINQWAMAASGRGDVAFSYLGQRKGQTTWDGYLTYTRRLPATLRSHAAVVLLSGRLNPPQRPLLYGSSIQGSGYLYGPGGAPVPYPPPFNNQMMGNDFIGAAIAPDGTPWGSFNQDCGPSPDSAGCRRQHDQTRGFAGYLG
jgi:hypothetical protein